jgi:cytoskeletal protein CcmA (bactofilin family)
VKANIEVQSALVSGVLVGNIQGAQKIEIMSEGRVVGDLNAPRVILRDGAAFKGKISMHGFEAPQELSAALDGGAESAPTKAIHSEVTAQIPAKPGSVWDLPSDDRPKKRRF